MIVGLVILVYGNSAITFFQDVKIYNNASIRYDTSYAHVTDSARKADTGIIIDNNSFWPVDGTRTVDAEWQTIIMLTADPKLVGELTPVDWDGQTGRTYWFRG